MFSLSLCVLVIACLINRFTVEGQSDIALLFCYDHIFTAGLIFSISPFSTFVHAVSIFQFIAVNF